MDIWSLSENLFNKNIIIEKNEKQFFDDLV
jgi:hypothetical protein